MNGVGGGVGGVLDHAGQIGRHFAVVSGIPSLVITSFAMILIAGGAPGARPSIRTAANALSGVDLAVFGFLLVIVLVVGLILQPFQFACTQFLEGYWGTSSLAQRGMTRNARRHLNRALALDAKSNAVSWDVDDHDDELMALSKEEKRLIARDKLTEDDAGRIDHRRFDVLHASLPARLLRQEADQVLGRYPVDRAEVMPTRLGNVLRRFEREAGEPYGLDAVVVTGLLAQVADETLRDYHDDARTDFDLTIQMVLMWAVLTLIGFVLLWRHGIWLLLPMITSLFSLVTYRGAVSAAQAYGEALTVLLALGRFRLYEHLGVPAPSTSDEEVDRNVLLMAQLRGERVSLDYRFGSPSA